MYNNDIALYMFVSTFHCMQNTLTIDKLLDKLESFVFDVFIVNIKCDEYNLSIHDTLTKSNHSGLWSMYTSLPKLVFKLKYSSVASNHGNSLSTIHFHVQTDW